MSDEDFVAAAWLGEESLLTGKTRSDSVALEVLLAADFHEIGQSGTHWTRDHMIHALTSDVAASLSKVLITDRRAHPVAAGLVLLTYRLEVDGNHSLRSSLWRDSGSRPTIVFHQGTPASVTP